MARDDDERTLLDILRALHSSAVQSRKTALEQLKGIIKLNQRNPGLKLLKDKNVHLIFEGLFSFATLEVETWTKALSKPASLSASTARLEMCATVFLAATKTLYPMMRFKTVKAILGHVIQVLPTADGGFCEPLINEYIGSLNIIFNHGAHSEHLDAETWLDAVDFCIQSIDVLQEQADEMETTPPMSFSRKIPARPSGSMRSSDVAWKPGLALLDCLRAVIRPPSCPFMGRAALVIKCIFDVLKRNTTSSSTQRIAFGALNTCIVRIAHNSRKLMDNIIHAVLPLIRSLWAKIKGSQRDDMLITLVYLQRYIAVLTGTFAGDDVVTDVEDLLQVLMEDYLARHDSRQLSLDDLYLGMERLAPLDVMPMQARTMALRKFKREEEAKDTEHEWTILSVIGFYASWLDVHISLMSRGTDQSQLSRSPKRRRTSSKLEDLINETLSAGPYSRVRPALRIICMLVQSRRMSELELVKVLEPLTQLMSHKDLDVANWAMISLAGCAFQALATSKAVSDKWPAILQFSIRSLSSASTCRASSHLARAILQFRLLEPEEVTECTEDLLSSFRSGGPATFCDSSLALWTVLADEKAAHASGSASMLGYEMMIDWISRKWSPSAIHDRTHVKQLASEASGQVIIAALRTVLNFDRAVRLSPLCMELGDIGRAWLWNRRSGPLSEWLLLFDNTHPLYESVVANDCTWTPRAGSAGANRSRLADPILAFLSLELTNVMSNWDEVEHGRMTTPDPSANYNAFTLGLVGAYIADLARKSTPKRAEIVGSAASELANELLSHAGHRENVLARNSFLEAIALVMPQLTPDISTAAIIEQARPFHQIWGLLAKNLEIDERGEEDDDEKFSTDDDDMGLISNGRATSGESIVFRSIGAAGNDANSSRLCLTNYCRFLDLLWLERTSVQTNTLIPRAFFDHLIEIPLQELVLLQPLLKKLVASPLSMPEVAGDLLVHFGARILKSYELNRCEITTCMLIDLMTGTSTIWTDAAVDPIYDMGQQLYSWLFELALTNGICSPDCLVLVADLLYKLLEIAPQFAEHADMPSTRTSLFGLLKDGDILVQHRVAERLSKVFDSFVLTQHEKILEDILESLPNDAGHLESILVRLTAFTQIGYVWKNLLRHCLYHIFETVGHVPEVERNAQWCIAEMVKHLELLDGRHLFRLFCSHMLYAWLETEPLSNVPFTIFGYDNMQECASDAQDDLISFIILRNEGTSLDMKLKELERMLAKDKKTILQESFSKATAHALASDIASTDPNGGVPHDAEIRIRDTVGGKAVYIECLRRNFSNIIGQFFLHLEQEENIERLLSKRKGYDNALAALQEINELSVPESSLSQSQQPSWKPKFFIDQIERLCRRSSKRADEIWGPALVTSVNRMLFNSIHDVFGPTHACRALQRVKILVCLAGPTALTGYPLEALLHGLRPFTTKKQCADYAIPTFHYLMDRGRKHLKNQPSFTVGAIVALLLSMRDLLHSTQDSTTQESSHRATLSKAQDFREWLAHYSEWLGAAFQDHQLGAQYRLALDAVKEPLGKGSAVRNTTEASLLLAILSGYGTRTCLFDRNASELCLKLLCEDFGRTPSLQDDVMKDVANKPSVALSIWNSLQQPNLSSNYIAWACKSLGYFFLCNGYSDLQFAVELRHDDLSRSKASKQRIMEAVVDHLRSEDSTVCGLVEVTLNENLQIYEGCEDFNNLTQAIPTAVIGGFLGSDRITPWRPLHAGEHARSFEESFLQINKLGASKWAQEVALALIDSARPVPMLPTLRKLLQVVESLSKDIFGPLLHETLLYHNGQSSGDSFRGVISDYCNRCLETSSPSTSPHVQILLNAFLYLRAQKRPREQNAFDRNTWLDIDYESAAKAATTSGMFTAALLFFETAHSAGDQIRAQKRSSSKRLSLSEIHSPATVSILAPILRGIDEPDAYYGIDQASDINAIADRLEYEGNEIQSLLFRGAQADSLQRSGKPEPTSTSASILRSLTKLSLNSLTSSFASSHPLSTENDDSATSLINAAIKLGQWDLSTDTTGSTADGIVYRALQAMSSFRSSQDLRLPVDTGMLEICKLMEHANWTGPRLQSSFHALASLCELDCLASSQNLEEFDLARIQMLKRGSWMESTSLDHIIPLLTSRGAFVSIINSNPQVREIMRLEPRKSLVVEAEIGLHSSGLYRRLGGSQEALSSVNYLFQVAEKVEAAGVSMNAAVLLEWAHVLWERGELISSIKAMQSLDRLQNLDTQAIPVGKAGLLADLVSTIGHAHNVSHARLENPEDILKRYLGPALIHLKDQFRGSEAGKVFHEYATYCHNQLDNPDALDDLRRSERFLRQRTAEVNELRHAVAASASGPERKVTEKEYNKVKRWQRLDDMEVSRLRSSRQQLLQSSLQNYLRSLAASDAFDTDVIRFLAIWFAYADDAIANEPVAEHSARVPTRKFALLMNQLASRLQEDKSDFQTILGQLVMRICEDHPYHGMHHIFAGSRTSGGHDSQAQSRKGAASRIAKLLEKTKGTASVWQAIARSNELYNKMAKIKSAEIKQGAKLSMLDFDDCRRVARDVPSLKVPPITMTIEIREDMNYQTVPAVARFREDFVIPGGVSAPKIVTAIGTDGNRYRQLFKGGTDDLRQDAIMEQVFEQVSVLLRRDKSTRQRRLRIRTYKVVPLDATSGVIEFVEPTMSFNEILEPAHQRYHPKEFKWVVARKKMSDVGELTHTARYHAYDEICKNFSPVLRHFFFERFLTPDEWFARRLAYTRSTAAISILGHVLGLGDRHCQNILIDTSTGEVVHIDLGVAFEAGRILPKPETVPFRLTRDVVDGFGVLKTEGVFRRCCEFTLEALRQNKDTILTLLNVLRYDPLYSWSVSPLKARRLQDEQESRLDDQQSAVAGASGRSTRQTRSGMVEANVIPHAAQESGSDEGGEADRALSTVEKKLAAGLSISATVNELIQQATDVKNLAVLFHGWAPYA